MRSAIRVGVLPTTPPSELLNANHRRPAVACPCPGRCCRRFARDESRSRVSPDRTAGSGRLCHRLSRCDDRGIHPHPEIEAGANRRGDHLDPAGHCCRPDGCRRLCHAGSLPAHVPGIRGALLLPAGRDHVHQRDDGAERVRMAPRLAGLLWLQPPTGLLDHRCDRLLPVAHRRQFDHGAGDVRRRHGCR